MEESLFQFEFPTIKPDIIKVIGVGGGGGNAVTHMFRSGIHDVTFVICNTDNQALLASEIPLKIQLGKSITAGLGAGSKPEVAKQAAEESEEDLIKLLSDGTKMVFITAGMGGGTGTGSAPIVAKIARDMGILTVGIVTIPFLFEQKPKILQALKGVEEIRKNVDALLVINNQKLIDMYGDLDVIEAFKKADSTLTTAARSIAEIITISGIVNLDFADVNTTMKNGDVAIMSNGYGEGAGRVSLAFDNALTSPLLNNNDIFNAQKILFNVYFSSNKPLKMDEMNEVTNFMSKFKKGIKVIWGTAIDDTLGNDVKVTILATGFGKRAIPMMDEILREENRLTNEEIRKKELEEEEERIYVEWLITEYYGEGVDGIMGKAALPKPVIFSIEQMDDNEIIEAVINHPAYNRHPRVMFEIEKQAKARLTYEDPTEVKDEEVY